MKRVIYLLAAFGIVAAASVWAAEPGDQPQLYSVQDDSYGPGSYYGPNRGDAVNFYINRAQSWIAQGEYDKAFADFSQELQLLHPNDVTSIATSYNNLGSIWHLKGDYDKAIADYNQALAINPNDAYAYNNRGFAWNAKGEYDKALADFNQALAINPTIENTYRHRGDVWRSKGEFDKAIADDNQALAINSVNAPAYDDRGKAWNLKGEYEKARADFSQAIAIDGNNAAYYDDLAFFQATCLDARYRDGQNAFANASKAYQITNGNSANNIAVLAAAYAESGDFAKAVEWQKKAIDLTKSDPTKQRYLARLALFQQGKPFRMNPKEADAKATQAPAPSLNKTLN